LAAAACAGARALLSSPCCCVAVPWLLVAVVVAGVSSQFNIMISCIRLLAGFAFFKAVVTGPHGAYGAKHFGLGQSGDRGCCRRGDRADAARRPGIQLTAAAG